MHIVHANGLLRTRIIGATTYLSRLFAPAQLEYRRQESGDLCTNQRIEFRALTNRVGHFRRLVRDQMGAEHREVRDALCIVLCDKSGGFTQCEGSEEPVRGKLKHRVAMCLRHGENKIGSGARIGIARQRNRWLCGGPPCQRVQLPVRVVGADHQQVGDGLLQ